jgi:hypothetical protein
MKVTACVVESHLLCEHRQSWLRADPDEVMCSCACHAACPLYAQDEVRPESVLLCTCPGAQKARAEGPPAEGRQFVPPEPGSMREYWDHSQEQLTQRQARGRAIEDAVRVVRATSAGRSRAEIRNILVTELRRNGVEPLPTESALDTLISDKVVGGSGLFARAHEIARGIKAAAKAGGKAGRDFKGIYDEITTEGEWTLHTNGRPFFITSDRSRSAIEVDLDASAQLRLTSTRDSSALHAAQLHEISVQLTLLREGPESGKIAVQVGREQVGFIGLDVSKLYQRIIEAAAKPNRSVVAQAVLSREVAGAPWRLHVFHPCADVPR